VLLLARSTSEVFQARPAGKRPRGRPRTRWRDDISSLAWEPLGSPRSELVDVARGKFGGVNSVNNRYQGYWLMKKTK